MITPFSPNEHKIENYSVLDIETGKKGELLAIGLLYKINNQIKYTTFNTWTDFIVYIRKNYKTETKLKTIYAHNGGNFDWLNFIEYLFKEKYNIDKFEFISNGSKGIGLKIRFNKKEPIINLRDSLCLLPGSLKNLSNSFNVTEKLEINDHPEELYKYNQKLFHEYLYNDCLSLYEIIAKFEDFLLNNFGEFGTMPLTIASLTMKLWRKSLDNHIMTPKNKELKELSRRSYIGGRTSVLIPGKHENINVLDINSMYPYIMVTNDFPTSYVGFWTRKFYPDKLSLYEIEYYQSDQNKPPLLRDESSKEYQYYGTGVFWNFEINKLFDIGGFIDLKKGYVFISTTNIFKKYQEKLYELRRKFQKDNDNAGAFVIKILANSLYGKFGQKPEGKVIKFLTGKDQIELLKKNVKFINHGNLCTVFEKRVIEHEFVAVSSLVTARARLLLYEYIEKSNNNTVYTDTDSLHLLPAGYIRLKNDISTELGKLKLEYSGTGIYIGKKLYAIHSDNIDIIKSKGIPTSKVTYNLIESLYNKSIDKKIIEYSTPTTLAEVINGKKSCVWYDRKRTVKHTIKEWYYDKLPEEYNYNDDYNDNDFKKEFRKLIVNQFGGIKLTYDKNDYKNVIPIHFRRNKTGSTIDQIISYLQKYPEYGITNETEFYNFMHDHFMKG